MTVLYDTTLRDGTQREGLSLSVREKFRVARILDDLGIPYIEGGWPGSNPKDAEFFERARDVEWKNAQLCAFGATRRRGFAVEEDPSITAMLRTHTPVCTIVGKSSSTHVREVLRVELDENLQMIEETVRYLVSCGREVVFDAEHFFDGFSLDPHYAMSTLRAASSAGAAAIVLCDTNGGSFPWDVERITKDVVRALDTTVGIHAHDDTGCAVANSLAAVRGGATHVQATMHGWGERCGNASLTAVAAALTTRFDMQVLPEGGLARLSAASDEVARIAGRTPDPHQPYVGKSAFAHKGGVHVAATRRLPDAYQHIDPALVGNQGRVVVSELSGRGNVLTFAEQLGFDPGGVVAAEVLQEIENEEAAGYSFDRAEGSVALRLRRRQHGYRHPFEVVRYRVQIGRGAGETPYAEVTVQTRVGERLLHTAGSGCGPIEAFDQALRKALEPEFPDIARMKLSDFAVRTLDGEAGTGATTRVWIEHTAGTRSWGTVGASDNLIEAARRALMDGFEHGISVLMEPRRVAS